MTQVIENTRNLIADVIGIPLAGILGDTDKTATEILIQNNNKESNVAVFYDNAYKANRTIGRVILEMMTGNDIPFELDILLQSQEQLLLNNRKESIVAVHM